VVILWTDFDEVSAFARSRAMALGITIVVRRTNDGWVLPYYDASWTQGVPGNLDQPYYVDPEPWSSYCDDDFNDCGDGSSGLSSNCGETLMEGYLLFNQS
jgi:hypothetical protein